MSQYTILEVIPAVGRTLWTIRHLSCGEVIRVYLWSFAGQGKRCPRCQEKIRYDPETHQEISPSQEKGAKVEG